jgi:homospermidine synthase
LHALKEKAMPTTAVSVTPVQFPGRLVMLGFGSIGRGVLPLLLKHITLSPDRIEILTAEPAGRAIAEEYGVRFQVEPLTKANYRQLLTSRLKRGDFLLNLSVDVSSLALIELCAEVGALYLDTCIEPWPGGYTDSSVAPSLRTNYALWWQARELQKKLGASAPTAVLTHGANPGLVSHFTKQALLNIAQDLGHDATAPKDRAGWARLAQRLGIKTIHIAERDTQVSARPKKPGEFVNTWSIDGFISEGSQPAELGWGTHERHFPHDGGRHDFGPRTGIFLHRPGAATKVRTWTPIEGPFQAFLITHGEAISIPNYFSVEQDGKLVYRPTCHYAYHPCDAAVLSVHELNGKNFEPPKSKRLMSEEITEGIDELGVLLAGHARGAYWFGSQLSIHEARRLAPHNSATSLQVTSPTMAGVVWAIENPARGIVDPDEMDYARVLEIVMPYLGPVVGAYSDWTPLAGRESLFPEDLDRADPWQFKNVRVL